MTEHQGSEGWRLPAAWVAAVVCGTVLLLVAGRAGLATPALADVAGWSAWVDATDPTVAVVALLRLAGLALCWYLVGVTGVALLARVLRLARLARLADLLAVGPVRSLVRHVVGAALAVGVVTSSAGGYVVAAPRPLAAAGAALGPDSGPDGADASDAHPATATMRRLGWARDERSAPAPLTGTDVPVPAPAARAAPHPSATPQPSPTAGAADQPVRPGGTSSWRSPADSGATPDPATDGAASRRRGDADGDRGGVEVRRVVEIAPGDHLWGLAAEDVGRALGRAPRDAEVVDHFAAVVAANADRLVVQGNPDLLVPGQQVVLPSVGGGR